MQSRFLIGAAASRSGKTTVTLGLLRAFARRGLTTQPFKCGPDYIDPMYHAVTSGRESINLDTFMASEEHVRTLFAHHGAEADVCVAEGAMGLFDGYDAARGSSSEMAALLELPVVMVVNARSVAYSVAPLLHGYNTFRPDLRIVGVIFNKVGTPSHYAFLTRAARDAGVEVLGCLPRSETFAAPSRHLGLSLENLDAFSPTVDAVADALEEHVDIDRLLELTRAPRLIAPATKPLVRGKLRIAVARDEAFNFIYRANLDRLAELGDVTFFSPIHDPLPPAGMDVIYLPGGYPEFFADEISANRSMRTEIARYAGSGGRVLAECGGMLYLCRWLVPEEGAEAVPMCGVLPLDGTMEGAYLHLGYRELWLDGVRWRGHEFHYSHTDGTLHSAARQTSAFGREVTAPFYRYKNVVASYTHLYWAESDPMALFKE